MLHQKLKQNLLEYSQQKQPETLTELLKLHITPQTLEQTNEELEHYIQCSFYDIVFNGNINDLCSLLNVLFTARKKNQMIRNRVVLFFMENVVECLCGVNLVKVMRVVVEGVGSLGVMTATETNKMHKVINQSLKKIERTPENNRLRGKLHVLLTSVLTLAHKSGLIQVTQTPKLTLSQPQQQSQSSSSTSWKSSQLPNHPSSSQDPTPILTQQQYTQNPIFTQQMPYKHYVNYWRIHKILNNKQFKKIPKQQIYSSPAYQKSLITNLKDLQFRIRQLLKYFILNPVQHHHPKQQYQLEYNEQQHEQQYTQSIKMTPIPEYLIQYHSTPQFREILAIQVLVYCKLFTESLNVIVDIDQSSLGIILDVVGSVQELILGQLAHLIQDKDKKEYLFKIMEIFYENQNKWIEIKYGDRRNIIKNLINLNEPGQNSLRYPNMTVVQNSQDSHNKTQLDLLESIPSMMNHSFIEEISSVSVGAKLGIGKSNMEKFIGADKQIKLMTKPVTTSYSYYLNDLNYIKRMNAIRNRYQNFDENKIREQNITKWKAMRCLTRQKLRGIATEQPIQFGGWKQHNPQQIKIQMVSTSFFNYHQGNKRGTSWMRSNHDTDTQ